MPAIVSLEHFNSMSENIQDEFQETSAAQPDEKVSITAEEISQADQPAEELVSGDEASPQGEQSATTESSQESENTLPPEAQGEANGGPLGCCLGVMIGLLLSLSLAVLSRAYASELAGVLQGNFGLLGLLVRIFMGILACAFAIFFGYVGWKMGKRFYRIYDQPPDRRSKRSSKSKKLEQKA